MLERGTTPFRAFRFHYHHQRVALRFVSQAMGVPGDARALSRLAMTRNTKRVLDELLRSRLIPETKPGDAFQMAVSAAHEVD
jgi:hypothetical protein